MAKVRENSANLNLFQVLLGVATGSLPAFDFDVFVQAHPWVIDLVAAAGEAGGFTPEVIFGNVPEALQKTAGPEECIHLLEFMTSFSERKGWPALPTLFGAKTLKRKPKRPKTRKPRIPKARFKKARSNRRPSPTSMTQQILAFVKNTITAKELFAKHGTYSQVAEYLSQKLGVDIKPGTLRSILQRNLNFRLGRGQRPKDEIARQQKTKVASGRGTEPKKPRARRGLTGPDRLFAMPKFQALAEATGSNSGAVQWLKQTYQLTGNQTKAAKAMEKFVVRDKGIRGFKISQREFSGLLKLAGIPALHPAIRRPKSKNA
ncbi:hypothetical protein C4546_04815 [Candidatus Parcubacteria bacterium]|jgi:hypothetical protein|nr:MAG: hypothetical protein C4546_04815 [Candidatus Parcubacteria bacterium]